MPCHSLPVRACRIVPDRRRRGSATVEPEVSAAPDSFPADDQPPQARFHRGRPARRRGAAAVEFAVVAPFLFLMVFGSIEFGRAMMAKELLANAARQGARAGAIAGKSDSDIASVVTTSLSSTGIAGASAPTVTVNGNSVNASTAATGDQVAVTVSVPVNSITWLPVSWFLSNTTLSETAVMRRE